MSDIVLYTAKTPNGIKIPIILEELGLPYIMEIMRLDPVELHTPHYLSINPNGKIPALVHRQEGGDDVRLFESGAISLYLAELADGLRGVSPQARADTLAWLFLQVSGLGPAMGNAAHFMAMRSPDRYAVGRFQGEARRQINLVEQRLSGTEWLNGESYSVADVAHFSWLRSASYAGEDIDNYPDVKSWVERIEERPATQRALARFSA